MVERMGLDEKLAATIESDRQQKSEEVSEKLSQSEEEEDWDDTLPPWASAASATTGVTIDNSPEKEPRPKRKGAAVMGFQSASDIVRSNRFEPVLPEQEAMTYRATPFGERVARLYLDPLSGHVLQVGLRKACEIIAGLDDELTLSPYSLLHLISTVPDFLVLWPRVSEGERLQLRLLSGESHELVTRDLLMQSKLDLDPLVHVKCAAAMEAWIDEISSRDIERNFGVAPGDLRLRIELADWLLYAGREITRYDEGDDKILEQPRKQLIRFLDELRLRISNGCKPDLLELVAIRGVGRIRARRFAKMGVRTVEDILELTEKDRQALADQRGWSLQLVDRIIEQATKVRGTTSRR
jgi:helicase